MPLEAMVDKYQKRTGYEGDISKVTGMISRDFNLGHIVTSHVVPIGYEDFNLCLETDKGKYFVKIYSTTRRDADCKRNVKIVESALTAGVQVPPLISSNQGYLWMKSVGGTKLRLCVMECIEGKDYFSAGVSPSIKDIRSIARQAALINTIDLRPSFIYDSWAIVNFASEFKKKKQYLPVEDLKLIKSIFYHFNKTGIKKLPRCLAHGDIISTNVVRDKKERNWIVDFSVANYYPRIQELAVLACDICFDPSSKRNSEKRFNIAVEEYQKRILLSKQELETLPLFIKVAHAMHVLCGTYEREANSNTTKENDCFIERGRAGLKQTD